jgi:hypothetical protein
MAALKEGSGTVPWGYAKPRGEQQGDLVDMTSLVDDLLIWDGSKVQLHFSLLFYSYSKIQIKLISWGGECSFLH